MEAKAHARTTLEINIISGENISADGSPMAENVYVVVRAESLNCCTTKMGKENGGNILAWNEKFMLDIPMHARSITFEVQCDKYKAARPIGVARIGLSDFLGRISGESGVQVMSYGLTNWDGRRNGVLHFSVRVAAAIVEEDWSCFESELDKGTKNASSGASDRDVAGYQVDKKSSNDDDDDFGCIPVRFRCSCLKFLKFSFVFGLVHKKKSV